ncbi:hypothetical protein O7632_06320 [Solwaraspora sp. WMMD406]|uniref:hypothetical protein n=1 Tax=Solwaraspora sp. WMMD406 TaxID=3016095 RepID=UPI002415B9B6|nr:hypothetical protein [Solwaraspora sp. WMMD406]MDG4763725.1 hypothetical protein [Solwaraspora sp. WMMD406]
MGGSSRMPAAATALLGGALVGLLALAGALVPLLPTGDPDSSADPSPEPSGASTDSAYPPGVDPCLGGYLVGTWRVTFDQRPPAATTRKTRY